jgi:hypothetical protein
MVVVILWLFNNAVPQQTEILKPRMRCECDLEVRTGEDVEEYGLG